MKRFSILALSLFSFATSTRSGSWRNYANIESAFKGKSNYVEGYSNVHTFFLSDHRSANSFRLRVELSLVYVAVLFQMLWLLSRPWNRAFCSKSDFQEQRGFGFPLSREWQCAPSLVILAYAGIHEYSNAHSKKPFSKGARGPNHISGISPCHRERRRPWQREACFGVTIANSWNNSPHHIPTRA